MKAYNGFEVRLQAFLTSVTDAGEWSIIYLCCFSSGERAPDTYRTGCWMGPKAVMAAFEKTKICWACQEWERDCPVSQLARHSIEFNLLKPSGNFTYRQV
jgi:hypothetical protein